MVRYACIGDLPRLLQLAEREHALSPWNEQQAFDSRSTESLMLRFIQLVNHTMLVSDRGYLAGVLQPLGFASVPVAIEFAWYAEDGEGMALLDKFEQWARNMGARSLIAHDHVTRGRLSQVLERRRGYRTLGAVLEKDL